MNDTFDDLQQSYGRCLRDRRFIERFYEILLARDPAIPPLFAHTDFNRQRMALRRGISIAISYAAGSAMVTRNIEEMADVHSRKGRAPVPPELYGHWLESLTQAISETDPDADPRLLQRWRAAMSRVIDTFSSRH